MTDASIDRAGMRCCMEHLEHRGHGVILRAVIDGIPTSTLLTNACHCVDGRRVRCSTCKRVWVHICGDSECAWHPVFPATRFRNPLSGGPYEPGYADIETVESLLLMVDVSLRPGAIQAWTPGELLAAADWALRTHLRASDNYNVRIPAKPAWVKEAEAPSVRGTSGTVFDLAPGLPQRIPDPVTPKSSVEQSAGEGPSK